jgi:hypothetical protein
MKTAPKAKNTNAKMAVSGVAWALRRDEHQIMRQRGQRQAQRDQEHREHTAFDRRHVKLGDLVL